MELGQSIRPFRILREVVFLLRIGHEVEKSLQRWLGFGGADAFPALGADAFLRP
jgi:hypothetical protein